jgi:hypothetical protein
MSIDGTYDCELNSPMGILPVKMTLTTCGDTFGGSCNTPLGNRNISGTLAAPDQIAFTTRVKYMLVSVILEVQAQVKDNEINGQVKAGRYGTAQLKGKKITST